MTATGPNDPTPRSERWTEDADRRRTDPDAVDRRSAAADRGDAYPHNGATSADARHDRADAELRHDAARADARDDREHADLRHEPAPVDLRRDREAVVARERERFGGVKVGSAFFGWLTATGALVLLTALAAAIAALVASLSGGIDDAVEGAERNLESAGLWGIIILLVIWFVAYYAGGYVAGRMARFDGAKQGVAVWAWAVVIALLAALIGLVAGQNFALPTGSLPTLPLPEDQATTAAIISVAAVALVALIGAVLGGMAGMRFHRRVDRAGFEVETERRP